MNGILSNEIMQKIAESIMDDIRRYREEREADNGENATEPHNLVPVSDILKKCLTPKYDAVSHWERSISSKLEIVNIIGKKDLAQAILVHLEQADNYIASENDKGRNLPVYNYVSAYDDLATGIITSWSS